MDQIDINLFNSWNRIGEEMRRDRVKALKRSRRRLTKALQRPPRAWCLVIRAADTRITPDNAYFEESDHVNGRMHDLLLTGELIAKLTRPVYIAWPGVPTWEAAKRLGVSHHFAWLQSRRGHLATSSHEYSMTHGRKCKPIPIVYTPSEVDPNQFRLKAPDAMWGELWKWKHEKIPAGYRQWARRVPRLLLRKGELVFRGWDWVCPGRLTRMDGAAADARAHVDDSLMMDNDVADAEQRDREFGVSLLDATCASRSIRRITIGFAPLGRG